MVFEFANIKGKNVLGESVGYLLGEIGRAIIDVFDAADEFFLC